MSLGNIPHEMRRYNQWICWRYDSDEKSKPTKTPWSPTIRGQMASVSEPDSWSDYDTAAKLYLDNPNIYAGIGFVLTENDPYCFIDLDHTTDLDNFARQRKVFDTFKSYSERSPSGKGLHIIGRGAIPSGRKRGQIEVYSSKRWMTMTGEVYNFAEIVDVSDLLSTLWSQMGKGDIKNFYDPNAPQTQSDDEILNLAANASNSDLFLDLYRGDFSARYSSQSEADQAFINIIAYYTQNRPQIIRLFHMSKLGQRDKAKRKDYLKWTINKAFDMLLPPVDIEGLAEAANILAAKARAKESPASPQVAPTGLLVGSREETRGPVKPVVADDMDSTEPSFQASGKNVPLHLKEPPTGLVGEIAEFIFKQSPRSVPEAALCGAIGLMSALTGRCYNVNGSGLNQYVLFLARTGSGKEAMSSGIDKLLQHVRQYVPMVDEFFGPSQLGSGQAVLKALDETPCFLSIVGEFDNMLKAMSDPNANSAMVVLKQVILDLYQKSGAGRVSRKMIYSDKAKNTGNIISPAFSLLGECTPKHLFQSINEDLLSSGLLPRFTIIEYIGKVNYINEKAFVAQPSDRLIQKIAELADYAFRLNTNNNVVHCNFTPDAKAMLDAFGRECTDKVNATTINGVEELWNRAHLKTLKLAATIAVGNNYINPIIDMRSADYAKSLILYDIANLIKRFEAGAMGAQTDETLQFTETRRAIKWFLLHEWDGKLASYGISQKMHSYKSMSATYFSRRLGKLAPFRKDRIGANNALKRAVRQMLDEGIIVEVDKKTAAEMFETTTQMYSIADPGYVMTFN